MPHKIESFEDSEQRYAELFKKLDKGGDGRIDIKDLSSELKDLGVSPSYAEVSRRSRKKKWNQHRDREVSLDKLLAVIEKSSEESTQYQKL